MPFGLSCCAGILSKCLQKAVYAKPGPGGPGFEQLAPRVSTLLFCEIVSRWSCDLWKVSHCLLTCCMLNNRIYTPVFLCPRNLAGKEFG